MAGASRGLLIRNYFQQSIISPPIKLLSTQKLFISQRSYSKMAPQEEEFIKDSSNRDIPFLFLPHTAFKPYFVHPDSSFPDVFNKYKWLTKTISNPKLPDGYDLECGIDEQTLEAFKKSLSQTFSFQKNPTNQNKAKYINERTYHNIFANLIRISLTNSVQYEHLTADNSQIFHYPILETHWVRNYKFYTTNLRPSFVLRTRNPLGILEEPRELLQSEVDALPGPFDTYSMNVYEKHMPSSHVRARPASDSFKFNPLPHCHTTLIVNNRMLRDEEYFAYGLMTMFAQLSSQALSQGVHHGTDLSKPLVTQCIVTNGEKATCMLLQLNTMNLMDDKGVWNRAWYLPVESIVERQNPNKIPTIYEMAERGEQLNGFNEQFCKNFAAMFRKNTL